MARHRFNRRPCLSLRTRVRGVSLIITLIALLLITVASVAMLRSFSTSSLLAGNLAFRRDLTNQGERAVVAARKLFLTGALSSEVARETDLLGANYSSTKLSANDEGIPLVLIKDSLFSGVGTAANDIIDQGAGVTVRYVIDRQCMASGPFSDGTCAATQGSVDTGGSNWLMKPDGESRPVYRLTVRVTGPRATQAYLQTTFEY